MNYEQALLFAKGCHYGVKDKCEVDYIEHPVAVAEDCPDYAKVVALLHDTVEDTGMTYKMLTKLGLSYDETIALMLVSREPDETYNDYMSLIKEEGKRGSFAGRIALAVKIADLRHNTSPARKFESKDYDWMMKRYKRELKELEEIWASLPPL